MEKLTILLVGSGGREHALAWKIAQSPLCGRLVAAPGNPGVKAVAELRAVKATDADGLVALAQEIGADLVVVGPESALEVGLADKLAQVGVPCFGGSQRAARLETSKAFTKDFCQRHDLPTAAYGVFEEVATASAFLDTLEAPFVIKADGLAAGKGVVIAPDRAAADAAVIDMLGGRFGSAGARVVIEEFMHGEEASLFAVCDGETAIFFGAAQDHKRAYDGDEGPNTGGMGTYSPPPALTQDLIDQAWRELIIPTALGYSGARGDEDRDSWPSGSWDRSRTMSILPTPREVDEEEEEAEKKKQQARKYEGVEEGAPVQEKPKEVAKPKPFDFVADWAKSKHRAEDAASRADALAAAVKAAERELEEQGLPLPYTEEEAREYSADIWKVFVQTR